MSGRCLENNAASIFSQSASVRKLRNNARRQKCGRGVIFRVLTLDHASAPFIQLNMLFRILIQA